MGSSINSPKQFQIQEISALQASEYNNLWHRTQPVIPPSNIWRNVRYVCYGAFFEGECYAVGIWSSPISRAWNKKPYLELRRFAISEKSPKYTATWMLGKMVKAIRLKFPEVIRLVSYQDPSEFEGIIYKAANWINDGKTPLSRWSYSRNGERKQGAIGIRKIRWIYNLQKEE